MASSHGHPAFSIVGVGRIGGMLARQAAEAGHSVHTAGRQGPTCHVEDTGPVMVCTRNDALEDVVDRTPPSRRRDLVFVQNGVLAPWLATRDLTACTVGVLYVAVAARGDTPVSGAPSVFAGPHAAAVVDVMNRGGVDARVALDADDLRAEVGTKLAWICITGVLGDAVQVPVGALLDEHEEAIRDLCAELLPFLRAHADLAAPPDLAERVIAYSRSVAHYRTAVKEWDWRNGWLLRAAAELGLDLPLHRRWLHRAGWGPATDAVAGTAPA